MLIFPHSMWSRLHTERTRFDECRCKEFIGRPNLPFKFIINLLRQMPLMHVWDFQNSYSVVDEDGKGMKV